MRLLQKNILLAAGIIAIGSSVNAQNIFVVENFDDLNFISEQWDNAIAGGPDVATSPGLGLAVRSRDLFPIGLASLESDFVVREGSGVFQLGGEDPDDGDQPFSRIQVSDRTVDFPNQAFQYTGYQLIRTSTPFDTTPYSHIRFAAWTENPAVSYENIADSGLVVSFGDGATSSSTGPFESTGTSVDPMPITNTPSAYSVQLDDANLFKADPVLESVLGGGLTANRAAIITLSIGLRRAANLTATTDVLGTRWFLDDIVFSATEPGIFTTGPIDTVLDEATAESTTFDIVLGAEPTAPVTVSIAPSAAGSLTINPASITFLPTGSTPGVGEALWNTSTNVSITAVEDSANNPNVDVEFSQTSDDTYYSSFAVTPISIQILDNDPPASFEDWTHF